MPEGQIATVTPPIKKPTSFIDSGWLPEAALVIGAFSFVFLLKTFGAKNTAKLANAQAASTTEIRNAKKIGANQIKRYRRGQLTNICLTIGTPGRPETTYLPNIEEGVVVCGAPGKGKTFSTIDRLIQSAIDSGFPTVLYDFKGDQMKLHVPYAAMKGYKIYVFAPGKDYSCKCNLLDFVKSPDDTLMARQLATIINRNTKEGSGNDNPFFSESGDLLLQSIFMLAKGCPYPDLVMAWNILSLPNLAQKLLQADELGLLPVWASIGAAALMAVGAAPETGGGITATGMTVFARFLNAQFLPCLMGESTMPLDLKGKTMIVFQTDKETRDVVTPLLATVIHLLISRNFARDREDPLVLALDEFPTLYLPSLVNWINEFRSAGFIPILGYQFAPQLEGRYGEKMAASIIAACATKFVYNPQDADTAEKYSLYCGETEIKTKSESRSYGKDAHRSDSVQPQKIRLFEPSTILRLPKGEAIFINPAYGNDKESAMPQRLKVKINKYDIKRIDKCKALWDQKVRRNLVRRTKEIANRRGETYDDRWALETMKIRKIYANEVLLPTVLPEDLEALGQMTPFSEDDVARATASAIAEAL